MSPPTRFAILEHDHPTLHWDFMLEADGVLLTWRLAAPPSLGDTPAEAIANHRLAYLTYEGPVSGNRGHVKRWDAGDYQTHTRTETLWTGELHGQTLHAHFRLTHIHAAAWLLTCTPR